MAKRVCSLKQCSICRRLLAPTLENFHRREKSPDGLQTCCKRCSAERNVAQQLRLRDPGVPEDRPVEPIRVVELGEGHRRVIFGQEWRTGPDAQRGPLCRSGQSSLVVDA